MSQHIFPLLSSFPGVKTIVPVPTSWLRPDRTFRSHCKTLFPPLSCNTQDCIISPCLFKNGSCSNMRFRNPRADFHSFTISVTHGADCSLPGGSKNHGQNSQKPSVPSATKNTSKHECKIVFCSFLVKTMSK